MFFRTAVFMFLFTGIHSAGADESRKSANPYSPDADLATAIRAYDGGDMVTALGAWRRAAAGGSTDAMTSLANIFQYGEGVRQDLPRAVAWYRRAADLGDGVAQMNLGELMADGRGTTRAAPGAYFWLSLAGRGGNAWADGQARIVAKRLPPDELTKLNARIAGWRPKQP